MDKQYADAREKVGAYFAGQQTRTAAVNPIKERGIDAIRSAVRDLAGMCNENGQRIIQIAARLGYSEPTGDEANVKAICNGSIDELRTAIAEVMTQQRGLMSHLNAIEAQV